MADYTNEEEQIEAIKKWWNEKGKNLVLASVAALAVLIGYQQWQSQGEDYAKEASSVYLQLQEKSKTQQPIDDLAKKLKTDFPKSTYAQFSSLLLAQQAVTKGDLDKAATELTWAVENGKDQSTKALAEIRLARVLFSQAKYDDVLKIVNKHTTGLYSMQFNELKGDVFVKQNKLKEAQEVYTEVSEAAKAADRTLPLLDLKLKSLAI